MEGYADPPRPPFDRELLEALDRLPSILTTFTHDGIAELRETTRTPDDATLGRNGKVEVSHLTAAAEGAADVPVLLLRPPRPAGPLPTAVWVHGGGLVAGDYHSVHTDLVDAVCDGRLAVLSVQYRLAPEHPYPAAVSDVYGAARWAAAAGADLGLDANRFVIAGVSAGGGLAAATALMARDRQTPVFSHQLLVYPMLDDRRTTPSSQLLDGDGVFDRTSNETGWRAYLGASAGGPDVDPYASPARATDLRGLPPTYLEVGSVDTLRDEVIDYAGRLARDGVPVDLHVWAGGYHGSDQLAPSAQVSRAATATRRAFLERVLRTP